MSITEARILRELQHQVATLAVLTEQLLEEQAVRRGSWPRYRRQSAAPARRGGRTMRHGSAGCGSVTRLRRRLPYRSALHGPRNTRGTSHPCPDAPWRRAGGTGVIRRRGERRHRGCDRARGACDQRRRTFDVLGEPGRTGARSRGRNAAGPVTSHSRFRAADTDTAAAADGAAGSGGPSSATDGSGSTGSAAAASSSTDASGYSVAGCVAAGGSLPGCTVTSPSRSVSQAAGSIRAGSYSSRPAGPLLPRLL